MKSSELIFFLGLFLWILQSYMIETDFLRFYGYFPCTLVRLTSLGLFAFKILFMDINYTKPVLFLSGVCLAIAIAVQFTANQTSINTFINVFIIIMAARNIRFEEITFFVFTVSGLCFLITIFSSFVGILDNSSITVGGVQRFYLGFDYVSFAPIYLINIIFCGFYTYTSKKKKSVPWIYIILALLIDYYIYYLTATRLAFGIVLIFVFLYIIVEKFHMPIFKNERVMHKVSVILFPLAGLITFVVSYLYDPANIKWKTLNQILSNRLLLNNRALSLYEIKWFGQVIEFNTDMSSGIDNYMFIDSGYINLLLQYGIIAFIAVLIIYTFIFGCSVKKHNNILTIWLICICIYNMINGMMLNPVSNSSLFAIWLFSGDVKKRRFGNGY